VFAIFGISGCNVNQNQVNHLKNKLTTGQISTQKIKDNITQKLSALGVITGFGNLSNGSGSIYINGVEYKFNGTSITVNGTTYTVSDIQSILSLLKSGQVVSLNGIDVGNGTGQAVSISVEKNVEGEVITNNVTADGSLDIMGLTVQTNADTVFESNVTDVTSLDAIKAGNIVQVSGFTTGNNSVLATRIDVISDSFSQGTVNEIKGVISNLTSTSFDIGNVTIDFSNANLDPNLVNDLIDGTLVDVKSDSAINGGIVNAVAVNLAKVLGVNQTDNQSATGKTELEGIITSVVSSTEIVVNQTTVLLSDTTQYKFGDASTAATGLRVTVFGALNTDGKLVADSLQYTPTGDIKIQGPIESVDVTNNSFTIFGKVFKLSSSTMANDAMTEGNHYQVKFNFDASALNVGDWINMKAYANGDGSFTVMRLERENHRPGMVDQDKLLGKVDSVDPLNFELVVDGITVDYSAQANLNVAVGDNVALKGNFLNGKFVVNQIQPDAKANDTHYVSGIDNSANEAKGNDTETGVDSSQYTSGQTTTNDPDPGSAQSATNGTNTGNSGTDADSSPDSNGQTSHTEDQSSPNSTNPSGSTTHADQYLESTVQSPSGAENSANDNKSAAEIDNSQDSNGQAISTGSSVTGNAAAEPNHNESATGIDNSQNSNDQSTDANSDQSSTGQTPGYTMSAGENSAGETNSNKSSSGVDNSQGNAEQASHVDANANETNHSHGHYG